MDGKVALGGGGIVTYFTSVWLVSTCVSFASSQTRMLLSSDAIDASGIIFGVFFLHVDFQGLLILVVPITFGALEGLARVSGCIPSQSPRHPG